MTSRLPDHYAILRDALRDVTALLRALDLLGGAERIRGGFKILCPWHDEKSPSCNVTARGQGGAILAHCFGCGEHHDAIDLIARVHRLDKSNPAERRRLLDVAAQLGGVTLDFGPGGRVDPQATPRPRPLPPSTPAPARPALDAFHATITALLTACPLVGSVGAGLGFRGIARDAHRDGWGELPVDLHSASREQDQRAGFALDDPAASDLLAHLDGSGLAASLPWLVRRGALAYKDHRLLIPWRTPQGKVWLLQRRWAPVFGDESGSGAPGGKYREDARAEGPAYPYGVDAPEVRGTGEIWLVEGAADVLAVRVLARAGVIARDVVPLGVPGVAGWKRVRDAVLPLVHGRSVVIATDNDPAGRDAVAGLAADLRQAKPSRLRRAAPSSKDWTEELVTMLRARNRAALTASQEGDLP